MLAFYHKLQELLKASSLEKRVGDYREDIYYYKLQSQQGLLNVLTVIIAYLMLILA